ncbi:MAG: protein kinase [Synergistaceae bacterium]|nr:protein kinase [Synergistaceae bacterium]
MFRDAGFDERTGRWYELQEYFPLGSLKDIPDERKRQPEFIRALAFELAEAIHCLHENSIIHCDIKPGNVLVRSLDPLDAVLTDFGIASFMAADVSRKMTSLKGTPMYWAPEAFSRIVGRPCDWWGLGMIVLELLSGAHPLEGLMDSQIIHRLTVGNVEIPDFVDEDWRLLLRGLLTKDDAKRWGHDEVARWLSGERDIPVYREASAAEPVGKDASRPFRFEGKNLHTPEEVARALCERELPWASAAQYLRYIRQWMESNMLFDEAVALGNATEKLESDMAMFDFVHTYVKGPFVYMGKVIDANNLRVFLSRVARREGSFAEGRIVRMLGDGTLAALYENYVRLTDNRDPLLEALFPVMEKKDPEDQWVCFDAVAAPGDYVWPRDADTGDARRAIEELKRLGVPPVRKSEVEDAGTGYVLPSCIGEALSDAETYALGVERLKILRDEKLLIPSGMDPHGVFAGDLPFEDYMARARVICMGHTPAVMARLTVVIEALNDLPLPASAPNAARPADGNPSGAEISRTLKRLKDLRNVKIGTRDTLFLARLVDLFRKRAQLLQGRKAFYPISAVLGGLIVWFAYAVLGFRGGLFLQTIFTIIVVGAVFSVLFSMETTHPGMNPSDILGVPPETPYGDQGGRGRRDFNSLLLVPFVAVIGSLIFFNAILASFPWGLPFGIGAMTGVGAYALYFRHAMKRAFTDIVEACFAWNNTPSA